MQAGLGIHSILCWTGEHHLEAIAESLPFNQDDYYALWAYLFTSDQWGILWWAGAAAMFETSNLFYNRYDCDDDSLGFVLRANYDNIVKVVTGQLDPMTAMMTSKLKVKGSMGYMMRNVPTVLDFVRVAREVTTQIL